jgi:hypothetical protein
MALSRPRRQTLTILTVLLAILVALWYFWPNRNLARARELQLQLAGEAGRHLPADQRRELWGQLRATMAKLSSEQRRDLFRGSREQEMKAYFALPPKEKVAYLDRHINRMQQRSKQAGPKGPPQKTLGKRPSNPEEREKWRKLRLDRSTPEQRAMRSEFFKDLQARRRQRGLPEFGSPGRRG